MPSMSADPSASPLADPHDGRPLLLTAATRWEAAPVAAALGLTPAGESRFEGVFAHRRVTLLKTGVGAPKTASALGGVKPADFGLALSVGLCGALQPGIRTGELVADVAEIELDYVVPLRETAQRLGLPLHFGRILHTNVVLSPEMKRKLGAEHRMLACDMETAALKRWARASGLPAVGLRAVLDELDQSVPADAPEGEDAASLARYALAHAKSLPALVMTGWRSARAMKTLSRLLAAYLEAL